MNGTSLLFAFSLLLVVAVHADDGSGWGTAIPRGCADKLKSCARAAPFLPIAEVEGRVGVELQEDLRVLRRNSAPTSGRFRPTGSKSKTSVVRRSEQPVQILEPKRFLSLSFVHAHGQATNLRRHLRIVLNFLNGLPTSIENHSIHTYSQIQQLVPQ
ncbi:hypothetical protein M3Y99_01106300 [Aphelenchoides fujianensis]|nr:hypothetical protein M3Y99_01106300 [Aphelenchoides fujianensis]